MKGKESIKRKAAAIIIVLVVGIGVFLVSMAVMSPAVADVGVDVQSILDDVAYLSSDEEFLPLSYRVTGLEGEQKAADFIEAAFRGNGLEAEQQEFNFEEVGKENRNIVSLTYKAGTTINPTTAKIVAGESVNETIMGKLVNFGSGTKETCESMKAQIKGKFILVKLDENTDIEYLSYLELSKAVKGIIIYYPSFVPSTEAYIANKYVMANGDAEEEKVMTTTTVTEEDYNSLLTELGNNSEIEISEYVDYDIEKETHQSQNVIAEKSVKNSDTVTPLIVVGAHYDCVNTPGADDNASGVAALIELTQFLSDKKLDCDVKFAAFGAEEIGLFGSDYFVSQLTQEELNRCELMINIDGPGIGEVFVIGKSTDESGELLAQNKACEVAEDNNIVCKKLEFCESDQFSFSQAGIPTITFASSGYLNKNDNTKKIDANYHTFKELEEENIVIPEENHTLNDTKDLIEASEKDNLNFEKLFVVLNGVFDSHYIDE